MQDVLTMSGRPVSRLGLAASPKMDEGCVDLAFEAGVSYFFFYNDSFSGMIDGLRRLLGRHREDVVVACGTEERDPRALRRDLDRMRMRLGTDVLDVFQANYVSPDEDPGPVFDPAGALSVIEGWRNAGLIRYAGASVHSRSLAVKLVQSGRIGLLMTRYNMAHRGAEEKVFPAALKAGVPVTAFTCTRWGSLLNPPQGWGPSQAVPAAADCYRFALRHPAVRVALCAPGTVERLDANLSVLRDGEGIAQDLFTVWEEYGRQVYGDGKDSFETRWP